MTCVPVDVCIAHTKQSLIYLFNDTFHSLQTYSINSLQAAAMAEMLEERTALAGEDAALKTRVDAAAAAPKYKDEL